MTDAAEIGAALVRLRARRPRVHCLMNTVVQKLVADGLTALGAAPSMTSSLEEIEAFISRADALLVNLGTMQEEQRQVITVAVSRMREGERPIVLDPVFCDVSPIRRDFARQLVAGGGLVVRGNAAEIAALGPSEALIIETGPVDRITGGGHRLGIGNGHRFLPLVSGTGCLSGAIVAAFMASVPDPMLAATAGVAVLGIAAELAAEESAGPGSFAPALLDVLYALEPDQVTRRLRLDHG